MLVAFLRSIVVAAAVLTAAGTFVLARMFLRNGRSAQDRTTGRAMVVFACVHLAAPFVALLIAGLFPVVSTVVSVGSVVTSGLLAFVLPVAISAAARP